MGNMFTQEERPPSPPPRRPDSPPPFIYEPLPVYGERAAPVNNVALPQRIFETTRRTRQACTYYARGTCSRGDACRFAHDGPAYPASARRSRKPCRFFAQGHCRKGDACPFSHDQSSQKEKDEEDIDFKDDDSIDNWSRELGGAWAEFGEGATITNISLPSDFSAIRIGNLPAASSVGCVMGLLWDVGLFISADEVRLMKPADLSKSTAIIKVKDPAFAKNACSKLRTCITIEDLEMVSIPVPTPKGSNFHQVDCRQVHCSWHRPTRTASLEFGAKEVAHRVLKKFSTGKYKVLGSKVWVNSPIAHGQEGGPRWTIKLTGLVETVKEQDIIQALAAPDKPRRIEIGEPNYVVDMDINSTMVKSMLYEFGPLDRWEVSPNTKGKRIKAQATFVEEAQARDAASSLDKKPLPFSETGKLFVQLVISVKFKVSTRVYEVVQKRINAHKAAWERQYIRFFAFTPRGPNRILKLEGEDRKLVVQAQKDLEKIIFGEAMRMDGKDLRYADFSINGDAYKRLKKIEKDLGVVIVRDVRSSRFRVFGSEESYTPATESLHRLIEEITLETHIIRLEQPDELRWAREGGIKVLESQLGHGKAVFNMRSRCIQVHGSEKDFTEAKLIMVRRQTESIKLRETNCTICLCEADEPIRTSCNHIYCSLCFVNMCQSQASQPRDFCIGCEGDSGRCKKVFLLSEIQNHLLSETFEDILEASFVSYVRRHPDQFRYCPTPDCTQIYRVTPESAASPTTFTCVRCLASACTACHDPHPGVSCAEHTGDASGGIEALNKIKEELGIKDCPKCSTAIEKTDGCNHMTCKGCGAHICWVCMATFDRGNIYDHMRRLHGGIGLG